MPRLLMFVPCFKVEVDPDTGMLSFNGIIENIDLGHPTHASQDAMSGPALVMPVPWVAFSLWSKTPEDGAAVFVQRVRLLNPDGRELLALQVEFDLPASLDRKQLAERIWANATGFPIDGFGPYLLQASLKRKGSNVAWKIVGEFPISVNRARLPDQG